MERKSTATATAAYRRRESYLRGRFVGSLTNNDEALSGIAATVGAKNANSVREIDGEKICQVGESPATAKREAKAADPLAWDDAKMAQA